MNIPNEYIAVAVIVLIIYFFYTSNKQSFKSKRKGKKNELKKNPENVSAVKTNISEIMKAQTAL